MPNALPIELRERAVRAYADGHESCEVVAERLSLNPWTLLRWIGRQRETGSVAPRPRGGGRVSPVDIPVLETVVRETRDATTEELTRAYNARVDRAHRVHRSSILRALHRTGYVFKKTAAACRTGPAGGPSRPGRVPRLGGAHRSGATGVCG
jgi:transposase